MRVKRGRITEEPGHWMARAGEIIGWKADGTPIHLMGGGAPDDDDDDRGDRDDDRDDRDGDDLDDLLDDVLDDDGDRDDDGDDDDRDDDRRDRSRRRGRRGGRRANRSRRRSRDDDYDDRDRDGLSRRDLDRVTDVVERTVDRRVNQLVQGRRRSTTRDDRDRDDDRDRGRSSSRSSRRDDDRDTAPTTPDTGEVREARLAFRGYMDDHTDVVRGESGRRMAGTLGAATIAAMLQPGDDPDDVGRRAARRVTDTISEYRRAVQRELLENLRRRGMLTAREDDDAGREGGTGRSIRSVGGGTTTKATRTARTRAAAYNASRGRGQQAAGS